MALFKINSKQKQSLTNKNSELDNLPAPSFLRLMGSLLYEILLLAALLMSVSLVFQVFFHFFGVNPITHWAFRAYLFAILYTYFRWCWTRGGQTLPMKSWWIRLEYADGSPLDVRGATVRFLMCSVIFIGIPAVSYWAWRTQLPLKQAVWAAISWTALPFLWRFFDLDHQTLHDRLSGTRIVWLGKPEK